MNILVTGGAGFIGSHFVNQIKENNVVVLDALTYAGDRKRLRNFNGTFIVGDIRNRDLLDEIFKSYAITHVVHFAAESHVDRSLIDHSIFLDTNVNGTHTVLEAADAYWSTTTTQYEGKFFLHISTDEVYGGIEFGKQPVTEEASLKPANPYATSKAAADQLVIGKMLGKRFPASIVRSSNNFGCNQHAEKLIPKVIHCLENDLPIPVYGKGDQMRCWLFVEDYCKILYKLMDLHKVGEIFNVAGPSALRNIETVSILKLAYEKWVGKTDSFVTYVTDRKMHDVYYNMDASKIMDVIGPFEFTNLEAYVKSGKIFDKG
ncbi:dTDP-glucose 4,6-dehydratase [Fusibacter tunisiensis]|uniref:dTDP-glucose 4,6-dehydratase n=1 Tax=Fusibacter tunisiensis TaxID=1008308 RepID=A0ABS2MS19_9FIRM|nr:GDP-mannose 4,6-dehydratase [Fusibacter tunisiensis]MBM7562097.1 dTDP-glucose 4,6-dehydratase [Fusibacter tunisiensis]